MTGLTIGIMGLALCALLCGVGSGLGLRATGNASAGVLAEDPSKFSKIIVLSLLPATQGSYGFCSTGFVARLERFLGGCFHDDRRCSFRLYARTYRRFLNRCSRQEG